jgi:glutaconate CoA-transferase subunit B
LSRKPVKDYTIYELLAVNVSKNLEDGDLVHVGIGGKGAVMAVGVPMAAIGLAQLAHAPSLTMFMGHTFNPKIDEMPAVLTETAIARWKCQARIEMWGANPGLINNPDHLDVTFSSGAQVDKYGNLNITVIGDYKKPKVRLIGCLAQPDQLANSRKSIILQEHQKRVFVDRVDFITSVGYYDGPDGRKKLGLRTDKLIRVFTDLAVLGFDDQTKLMKLESVHEGITVDKVLENTGFDLIVPKKVPTTPPPTAEELDLLRRRIDPRRALLEPSERIASY